MGIGKLSDLRTSRSIKRVIAACAIIFALAVVYRVVWEVTVGIPQSRLYEQTVLWAKDAEQLIRLDRRFAKVQVFVPLRVNASTGMSFFLKVDGFVLSEADDADLRSLLEARKPPIQLRWGVHSCMGDEQLFNSLRGYDETETPP